MTDQNTHSTRSPRQIPAWTHTVGPGWTALLDQLHRDLLTLAPDYQLDSLTTRFGSLRIHLTNRFDEAGEYDGAFVDAATALTDAAETASEHTCEHCAAPGHPRFRSDHHRTWIS
ncbi:hypothetical protein [Streptomyces zagrosensis]|uniref:Uncharacterized protein n=1 Tax=Streptomyces zagrosensis TaxID=1042984 RepID=A0A7W9V220_9ACTN|nr:hypothetical protein [Streptomyces zagrosensis]MBB5939527.1 hypothetical protein [Streptomyces zagrosensis]